MAAEENGTAVAKPEVASGFGSVSGIDSIVRSGKIIAMSKLIPKEYQNNVPDCVIALEMAQRLGVPCMMVMQNLYIVHGKPSWSSQFIIAAVNSTGKFSPLRFRITGAGDDKTCVAYSTELKTGEVLESPPVSIGMAKKEGWFARNGSKWQTMPDLMLRYRTATFFGRLYAPEVLMGMRSEEEVIDIDASEVSGSCSTLPPMPSSIIEGAPEPEAPPQDATDAEPARTIEDEIREVGECIGKKPVEIAALIKQHAKAGTLETLRDQFRADYKNPGAAG